MSKELVLNHVPANLSELRNFLSNLGEGRYYEVIDENNLVVDEVDVNGKQYLIEIDLSNGTLTFVDDLVSIESALNTSYDFEDSERNEWKERYNELESELKNLGFRLYPGEGMNDDYEWYKIETKAEDFNISQLEKASTLWNDYNIERRSILEKI